MKKKEDIPVIRCDCCNVAILVDGRQFCGGVLMRRCPDQPIEIFRLPEFKHYTGIWHLCDACLTGIKVAKIREKEKANR